MLYQKHPPNLTTWVKGSTPHRDLPGPHQHASLTGNFWASDWTCKQIIKQAINYRRTWMQVSRRLHLLMIYYQLVFTNMHQLNCKLRATDLDQFVPNLWLCSQNTTTTKSTAGEPATWRVLRPSRQPVAVQTAENQLFINHAAWFLFYLAESLDDFAIGQVSLLYLMRYLFLASSVLDGAMFGDMWNIICHRAAGRPQTVFLITK